MQNGETSEQKQAARELASTKGEIHSNDSMPKFQEEDSDDIYIPSYVFSLFDLTSHVTDSVTFDPSKRKNRLVKKNESFFKVYSRLTTTRLIFADKKRFMTIYKKYSQ